MKKRWIFFSIFLLMIVGVSATFAATNDNFAISWFTMDGGGGTSSGGDFSLSGTIGQPDAGSMNNNGFSLDGGFWNPANKPISTVGPTPMPTVGPTPMPASHLLYLPLTIK